MAMDPDMDVDARSRYSLQFRHPNPISRVATSRTTRYRILKKRKAEQRYHDDDCDYPVLYDDTDLDTGTVDTDQPLAFPDFNQDIQDSQETQNDRCIDTTDFLTDLLPEESSVNELVGLCPFEEDHPTTDDSTMLDLVAHDTRCSRIPPTLSSSSLLSMQCSMRHNLTEEALSDLLQVIKLCRNSQDSIPSTVYLFKKQFECLKYPLDFHYFCSRCLQLLSSNRLSLCPNECCNSNLSSTGAVSSFIELPLESQLVSLMQRKLNRVKI